MKKHLPIVMLCLITISLASSCSLRPKNGNVDQGNVDPGGYSWSKIASVSDAICSLTASDPEHVWAACVAYSKGSILFYDGQSWGQQLDIGGYIKRVTSTDVDHAWAIVEEGVETGDSRFYIYSYDGSTWGKQYESERELTDVYALDSDHVWVAGVDGLLFSDGSGWSRLQVPEGAEFRCVSATDTSHVWAGTYDGQIYFFDGKDWQEQFEQLSVRDIFALSPSSVWAATGGSIGNGGSVLFYDGYSWKEELSAEKDVIFEISGIDSNHVWAIGTRSGSTSPESDIYFFDGKEWKTQYKVEEGLMCIFALDDEYIWAGSSWGSIYKGTSNAPDGQ